MFDDLRQDADQGFEEDADEFVIQQPPRAKSKLFLGMTSPQRFLIAVILLVWIITLSCFLLMATDKIIFG